MQNKKTCHEEGFQTNIATEKNYIIFKPTSRCSVQPARLTAEFDVPVVGKKIQHSASAVKQPCLYIVRCKQRTTSSIRKSSTKPSSIAVRLRKNAYTSKVYGLTRSWTRVCIVKLYCTQSAAVILPLNVAQ